MKILVTGGAGYIGSHTVADLLSLGHEVVVVDSLIHGNREALDRVGTITGAEARFHEFDLRDVRRLRDLFAVERFDACMHLAALKSVAESTAHPTRYYDNNLGSSLALLSAMQGAGCRRLVFSSSATVYGGAAPVPVSEDHEVGRGVTNPYGHSKVMVEQILGDASAADPELEVSILRYFNPIGAHPTGLLGEFGSGTPENLAPYILDVAAGRRDHVRIFGNDYPTRDGTGVRDYVHVMDIARGHVAALEHSGPGVRTVNLGTGTGTTVLELVGAFEAASGVPIAVSMEGRRPGDVAESFADVARAKDQLGWTASLTIAQACEDAWRWQRRDRAAAAP